MVRRKFLYLQVFSFFAFATLVWSDVGLAGITRTSRAGLENIAVSIESVDFEAIELYGQKFVRPQLKGVGNSVGVLYREGMPDVPVIRFTVSGRPKVRVGTSQRAQVAAGLPLAPVQPSRVKLPDVKHGLVWNRSSYATNSVYPEVTHEIKQIGSVRGVPQYQVTLFPIRVNSAASSYELIADFEISFASEQARQLNGDDTFVFVVAQEFKRSPSLAAYAKLKEQLGYTVRFLTMGEDVNTPNEIRAAIQAIYQNSAYNLLHAMVIGDSELVPGYATPHIKGITDHYYRAIDTEDYNNDINGPDIGVGRVSVKTEEQLATVLNKFTRYVRGNFANQEWLDQVAFIATDDRWEVAEGTHNYVIENYTNTHGYTGIFPENPMTGGDQLYAITHRVPDATVHAVMDSGRTIINYSGHGGRTLWAGPHVDQNDVRAMTDADALPFVISNACITGDFRTDESFGETWQRHHAGAITFWGSMDNTYWDEDDILERRMYDGIYKYDQTNFSQITNYALAEVWLYYGGEGRSRYYWETYVLFGDPSLQLRTTPTKTLSLIGPQAIPMGVNEVQYTLTDNTGAPVQGARVALSLDERGLSVAGTTDLTGLVSFQIAEVAREPASLLATAQAYNGELLTQTIEIIASDAPFLGLQGFTVNGRELANVYAGETLDVDLQLKNLGLKATKGGTLEVLAVSGPAKMISGQTGVPALASGETASLSSAAILEVNDDASTGDAIRVQMNWQTQEGVSSKFAMIMTVTRGQLQIVGLDYGEEQENVHDGIRPGESGSLYLTVKNVGNDTMNIGQIMGSLLGDSCVEQIDGVLSLPSLVPGQVARIAQPLLVTVDGECTNGQRAFFDVMGSYESPVGSLTLNSAVDFTVGVTSTDTVNSENQLAIPDKGPEVSQVLPFSLSGRIVDVGVFVKITHPYIGDLVVTLAHPDGTRVALHAREGSSDDNIQRHYGMGGEEWLALKNLVGKEAKGDWQLIVQDQAENDIGTLETVELQIKGFFP